MPHEHAVADEREDDGVGVQRTQAAEGGELQVQVQLRPEQLAGDQQSCAVPTSPQIDGGDGKGADDVVVVFERLDAGPGRAARLKRFWARVCRCFYTHGDLQSWVLEFALSSSVKIRMPGVQVSSYCPDLTAQTKAAKNDRAMVRLARMRIRMTDIAIQQAA